MVGRVRVRGQGPVRRGQTTTTFKKGGRVKLWGGGRPSARTRHIENEKEEIRRVDRNIRKNEGYKTGGRVKKASGGMSLVRKLSKIDKESRRKLNPHQDAPWGILRHRIDNPPKKKKTIRSPHTDKKKRTLRHSPRMEDYFKHLRKGPRKPIAKRPGPGVATRRTRPTPRNK